MASLVEKRRIAELQAELSAKETEVKRLRSELDRYLNSHGDASDVCTIHESQLNHSKEFQAPGAETSVSESPTAEGASTRELSPTEVSYSLVERSSKKNKDKLCDSTGYSYMLKKRNKDGSSTWKCPVRNKDTRYCPATVCMSPDGSTFQRNEKEHTHPPKTGCAEEVKLKKEIKDLATKDPTKTTSSIIQQVLLKEGSGGSSCSSLPRMDSWVRAVNLYRSKECPKDPSQMHFDIDEDHLPSHFLRGDLKGDDYRHLLFATDPQLELLATTKCWYIDSTLKLTKAPFQQLLSVHTFVKRDGKAEQVPLVFVFMTSRRMEDCEVVLQCLKSWRDRFAVERVVLDFEPAIWRAVPKIFPQVQLKGCAFHWGQAVVQKVQELGLQTSYNSDSNVRKFIKELMALRFLPEQHIGPVFDSLTAGVSMPALGELVKYVQRTWIEGSLWPPSCWSVFSMVVRTSRDVEGWHRGLNSRGRARQSFYTLIHLLHQEAKLVEGQIISVESDQLLCLQRLTYQHFHAKLFQLWDEYSRGEKTTLHLLSACKELHAPYA